MNIDKLNEVLAQHKLWLENMGGSRADLSRADLSGAYLSGADLRDAYLSDAYLSGADLRGANLRGANLRGAYLRGANLSRANLIDANLRGADLRDAYLSGAKYSNTQINLQCPEFGQFTAFKKLNNGFVATLIIPEHAKRSSATTRKCRASEVLCIDISNRKGEQLQEQKSKRGGVYKVGETTFPDSFDDDRWNECSNGIHFFITRKEAEEYND